MAKNEFLEGKYKGKVFVKRMDGKLSILTGFFKQTILDENNICKIEVVNQNNNTNMVTIIFNNGEKSLVEVDKDIFEKLMRINWNISNK